MNVLASDRQQDLADSDASAHSLWLAERSPHAGLQPISTSAGKHLVDAQHVEWVDAYPQVEGVLACILDHILVGCNPGSLQRLAGDLLLLPTAARVVSKRRRPMIGGSGA